MCAEQMEIELFVATDGSDAWSGQRPDPNRGRTDGPLASLAAALEAARELRAAGDAARGVRICMRGGLYCLPSPVRVGPADSGVAKRGSLTRMYDDPPRPLSIVAYPGETPVLSGGRRIEEWRETTVNGTAAWVASVPSVRRGAWNFRQLWVNGERRYRPRQPREGRFKFARTVRELTLQDTPYNCGADRFVYAPGDLCPDWRNLQDVEILFNNFWVDQRMRIRSLDSGRRLAVLDRMTETRLIDDSWADDADLEAFLGFYTVENVFEALDRPGEWYLDRAEEALYYLPMPGEDMAAAEVIAPRLEHILRVEGESLDESPVQEVRFERITFAHTEWAPTSDRAAPGAQAACDASGAVTLRNAHTVEFRDCTFAHVGGYAIECAEATRDVTVGGCDIHDAGGGGVKIWHGCTRTTVSDCRIRDGGRVYESAVGILIGKASGNRVLHNAVHDFGYSGISVGWDWTDGDGQAYGNVIEYNHIYNIGRGELSDLGGIYTLSVSPGTRIRNNIIHDVRHRTHFGRGIYLDAGSSYMLVEGNLVYRAQESPLMMNQSRGHVICNNIFALGQKDQVRRNVLVAFPTCTFERNIVYSAGSPLWTGNWKANHADLHHNLYFVAGGKRPEFGAPVRHPRQAQQPRGLSFEQWQERGLDADSVVADPKFGDPENGDFRMAEDSPAFQLGFRPLDLARAGPRSDGDAGCAPQSVVQQSAP